MKEEKKKTAGPWSRKKRLVLEEREKREEWAPTWTQDVHARDDYENHENDAARADTIATRHDVRGETCSLPVHDVDVHGGDGTRWRWRQRGGRGGERGRSRSRERR